MGQSKMGRHRSSEKGWQVSTLWKKIINRFKKKIPEVRSTCESHTDDKRRKGLCLGLGITADPAINKQKESSQHE